MSSRLLSDLDARVVDKAIGVLAAWKRAGHEVLVTCTFRSSQEQAALYAQGRTTPGPVVTHARPGHSYHERGLAIDFVPLVNGKACWDDSHAVFGALAEIAHGVDPRIVWGGNFPRGERDAPHIEWHLPAAA